VPWRYQRNNFCGPTTYLPHHRGVERYMKVVLNMHIDTEPGKRVSVERTNNQSGTLTAPFFHPASSLVAVRPGTRWFTRRMEPEKLACGHHDSGFPHGLFQINMTGLSPDPHIYTCLGLARNMFHDLIGHKEGREDTMRMVLTRSPVSLT
jgi:hypothetical protein